MSSPLVPANWKKDGLPCIITDQQVTVTLPNGKPVSVPATDQARHNHLLDAIRECRWEDVPKIADKAYAIKVQSDGRFEVKDDWVYIGERKLPDSLSKRLLEYVKRELPIEPLLKFWDNLLENPSYHSVQQLHGFLEANNHGLTPDGCFLAYRSVRSDYLDKHTGTMDNSPGKVVRMPRNEVDENPKVDCSNGLHVADFKYAESFGGGGDKLMVVKVNPRDVVAVPDAYGQQKMRVCQFEVLSEVREEIDEPLYDDGSELDGPEAPAVLAANEDKPQLPPADEDEYEDEYDDDDDEY